MKPVKAFRRELNRIVGIPVKKVHCRAIGVECLNKPLDALQSKLYGGRYNFRDKFEALYFAPDPCTAIKECLGTVKFGSRVISFKFPPKAILSIDVDLQNIIDLEDGRVINILGIQTSELTKPWRHIQDVFGKEAYTQILGRLIYESKKFEGIRYPSAKVLGKYNLVVFLDRIKVLKQTNVYDPRSVLKKIVVR